MSGGQNGHKGPGRPSKSLLERLLEGSFRPNHHARLLDEDELPAEAPAGWSPEVWEQVLSHQARFQTTIGKFERRDHAYAIARLAVDRKEKAATLPQIMCAVWGPNLALGAPGTETRRRYATALAIWYQWRRFDGLAWVVANNVQPLTPSYEAELAATYGTAEKLRKAWAGHEIRDPPVDDDPPRRYGVKDADVDEVEALLADRWPAA